MANPVQLFHIDNKFPFQPIVPTAVGQSHRPVAANTMISLAPAIRPSFNVLPNDAELAPITLREVRLNDYLVSNEREATEALRNYGDYKFYFKSSSSSETQNLKRIMIRLPILGNRKFIVPDSLSFDLLKIYIRSMDFFISMIGLHSDDEETAKKVLFEKNKTNNFRLVLNSSGNPIKILIKIGDSIFSIGIDNPVSTPGDLLNQIEENFCLITRGTRH